MIARHIRLALLTSGFSLLAAGAAALPLLWQGSALRFFLTGAEADIARDDSNLAFHVAAPGFIGERDRLARPQEAVGAALIHQRIGPERLGHLRLARLTDELHVIHIC